jgi:hypothetical protein
MTGNTLGPFETSGDALLAVRPEDGSFTGREALFDLLKNTMQAGGVSLSGWDWVVLRWLAELDVQTVAAVAGWVSRANLADVVLTAGHEAVVAQALADAEKYRRRRAGDWCGDCAATPAGACDDHLDDLDAADAYRDLPPSWPRSSPRPRMVPGDRHHARGDARGAARARPPAGPGGHPPPSRDRPGLARPRPDAGLADGGEAAPAARGLAGARHVGAGRRLPG